MDLLTIEALAVAAGCGKRSIERAMAAGNGPTPIRIGKLVRFSPQAVASWLNARSAA